MPNLHTLHPEQQFTQLPNDVYDRLPSLGGPGYLGHLLRHRDGYVPSLDSLIERKARVSRRDAQKARAEIMEYGYRVDVRFQHSDGGQFHTDVWRSVYPHTAEDIAAIAARYRPGQVAQIPQHDGQRRPQRDGQGNLLMRQVLITWADVTSWQGARQRVEPDGTLAGEPVDNSPDVSAGQPELPDPVGREPGTNVPRRGTGCGHPAPPAETPVFPGRAEVPESGGSVPRGVGGREVYKNTRENTTEKTEKTPTFGNTQKSAKGVPESSGHLEYFGTKQHNLESNPELARGCASSPAPSDAEPDANDATLTSVDGHGQASDHDGTLPFWPSLAPDLPDNGQRQRPDVHQAPCGLLRDDPSIDARFLPRSVREREAG